MIRSTGILDVARGRGRAMGSIARSNAIARGRRGGAIDDRSRVDGDERARSNARSIAIRRWAEGKIWCVDGVCVWMFDGGMWGVYMGRVDGWRMRKRRASLRLSSSRCVSSFEGVRRDD